MLDFYHKSGKLTVRKQKSNSKATESKGVVRMVEQRKAPKEGPHGVDAWTCNGYGLILDGKEADPVEEKEKKPVSRNIDRIEEV